MSRVAGFCLLVRLQAEPSHYINLEAAEEQQEQGLRFCFRLFAQTRKSALQLESVNKINIHTSADIICSSCSWKIALQVTHWRLTCWPRPPPTHFQHDDRFLTGVYQ